MRRSARPFLSALFAVLVCAVPGSAPAFAQDTKRVALVIGNGDYQTVSTLPNAERDAVALAEALGRAGFEVKRLANADLATLRGALEEFQHSAAGADAALVFYAGHALSQRNAGRLVPVDASLQDQASIERSTLPIAQFDGALAKARNAFLLADGCADARLSERLQWAGATLGLGTPTARPEAMIAIASAEERACGERLFVDSLLVELEEPGIDAVRLFRHVQQVVAFRSNGRQTVAMASGLAAPFFFVGEDLPLSAFRRLGVDPAVEAMDGHVRKYNGDILTPVVRSLRSEKESLQRRPHGGETARNWHGLIDDSWSKARLDKARAARSEAVEARWSREKDTQLAALTPAPLEEERKQQQAEQERKRQAEQARKEEEERKQQQAEQERKRQAEQARKEEDERKQQQAEQERKRQAEQARKEEDERKQQQAEQERKRQAEQARKEEDERKQQQAEQERKRQVEQARKEEDERKQQQAEQERKRQAEQARKEEDERKQQQAEQERKRQAEQARKEEDERKQQQVEQERKRLAEQARKEEDERKQQQAEQERKRQAEQARKEEDERKQQQVEQERKRLAEQARKEEDERKQQQAEQERKRQAEQARKEEEERKLAEQRTFSGNTPSPAIDSAPKSGKPSSDKAPSARLEEVVPSPPSQPPPPDPKSDQRMAILTPPSVPPSSRPADKPSSPSATAEEPASPRPEPPHQAAPAPAPGEQNTASLPPPNAPPAPAPPPPTPAFNPDTPENIRAAQQELKRLGCYGGAVDGVTGPGTRGALGAAAGKLPGAGVNPLTEQGLRALREHKDILCPPAAIATRAIPPAHPASPAPAPQPTAPPPPAAATPAPPPPPVVQQTPPPAPAPPPVAPPAPDKSKIRLSM